MRCQWSEQTRTSCITKNKAVVHSKGDYVRYSGDFGAARRELVADDVSIEDGLFLWRDAAGIK